ncbi:MAG: ornithine carbamoyltransferase [bacterium]|nr:MAG: ornithine carbamoyltransferase [bacterium]
MARDFLTLEDFSSEEIQKLLEETIRLKKGLNKNLKNRPRDGGKPLEGKTLGMIFTKSSTRTRMGFEVGMYQLGGYAMLLRPDDIQIGRGESLADTAKIMSRYLDGLAVRTYEQSDLVELAEHSSIPVINALTDKCHPCQAVADYATLLEKKGTLENMKLAYIGDGNNVAHSLITGGALLGVDVSVATPASHAPDEAVVKKAGEFIKSSGGSFTLYNDPEKAVKNADAVYTDVWVSMGHEGEAEERNKIFEGYIVDEKLLESAKPDCCVMHCLPAYRGKEISADALDGPQSIVLDQAENKLHAQKAILEMALGD